MRDPTCGAIFDLDGTLVASEPLYFRATEAMLSPLGRSLDELTPLERSRIPGRAAHENMAFYRTKYGLSDPPDVLTRVRMDAVCRLLEEDGVELIPGALEFLSALRGAGVRLALASSSPARYVQRVLERTGLGTWFQAVRTGDDVTRWKPDPQIFLLALADLGLPAGRCVVVEDAHSGILAGLAAGMKVLAVDSEYTLPEQSALAARRIADFRGLGPADLWAMIGEGA